MIRDVSLDQIRAHLAPYLLQEVERVSSEVLLQKTASQCLANGELIPIVDVNRYGEVDHSTLTLKIKKVSPVGIFQGHTCFATGTNVMSQKVSVLNIPLRPVTGDVVVCYNDLLKMYDKVMRIDPGHSLIESGSIEGLNLLNKNDLHPLVAGYRNYVETYGYSGDLSLGVNGLASVPSVQYQFPTPWATLAGDALLATIIDPVTAATVANYGVDFRKLALPTAAYNTVLTKVIPGTSDTVLMSLERVFDSVVKCQALDNAFGSAPVALYLPGDSDETLVYGNGGELLIDFHNDGDRIVVRGYAIVAGVIALESGNLIRATGM